MWNWVKNAEKGNHKWQSTLHNAQCREGNSSDFLLLGLRLINIFSFRRRLMRSSLYTMGRKRSFHPMALGCRYTWVSWWPYNGHKGIQSMEEESGDPNNRAVKISMLPLHKTLWQAVKSTVSTSQFTEVPHLLLIVRGPTTVPGWDTWTRK